MRRSTGVSWYGAASIADLGSSSKYSTLASFTLGNLYSPLFLVCVCVSSVLIRLWSKDWRTACCGELAGICSQCSTPLQS